MFRILDETLFPRGEVCACCCWLAFEGDPFLSVARGRCDIERLDVRDVVGRSTTGEFEAEVEEECRTSLVISSSYSRRVTLAWAGVLLEKLFF